MKNRRGTKRAWKAKGREDSGKGEKNKGNFLDPLRTSS